MAKRQARYQIDRNKHLSPTEEASLEATLEMLAASQCPRLKRNALFIELLLWSGARQSEILLLTTKDLHDADRAISITATKQSNSRTIPLPSPLYKRLSLYARTEVIAGERLFQFTTKHARTIWNQMNQTDKSLHKLRHHKAVTLLKKSKDLNLVKQVLGHRNIMNTMVYAEYLNTTEDLRRMMIDESE